MPPQPPRPPTPSQRYQNGHTYIPPHAERAIAEQLQHTLPANLKQYAGAYMEQHVGSSSLGSLNTAQTSQFKPHAPGFHLPRQTGSFRPHGQAAQDQSAPQPADPFNLSLDETLAAAPPASAPAQQNFRLALPAANSLPVRIAYGAGGLLVLVILFSIVKGLVAGGPDLTPWTAVAEDQQELIHIVSSITPNEQQNLSTNSVNFAATTQLSVSSAQAALLNYLVLNHKAIAPKTLGLKISSSIDNQLAAAAAATTLDQTFQQVMQTQLKTYTSDLSQAYSKTTGTHGKALLKSDYHQANLLLTQLGQPSA